MAGECELRLSEHIHHQKITPLTADQKKQLKRAGIVIKRGYYSHEEDARIWKNYRRFCKYLGVSTEAVFNSLMLRDRSSSRKEFQRHPIGPALCYKLPNRTFTQVMFRVRYLCELKFRDTQTSLTNDDKRQYRDLVYGGVSDRKAAIEMNKTTNDIYTLGRQLGLRSGYRPAPPPEGFTEFQQNIIDAIIQSSSDPSMTLDDVMALNDEDFELYNESVIWEDVCALTNHQKWKCMRAWLVARRRKLALQSYRERRMLAGNGGNDEQTMKEELSTSNHSEESQRRIWKEKKKSKKKDEPQKTDDRMPSYDGTSADYWDDEWIEMNAKPKKRKKDKERREKEDQGVWEENPEDGGSAPSKNGRHKTNVEREEWWRTESKVMTKERRPYDAIMDEDRRMPKEKTTNGEEWRDQDESWPDDREHGAQQSSKRKKRRDPDEEEDGEGRKAILFSPRDKSLERKKKRRQT